MTTTTAEKSLLLLSLAVMRPGEFFDRLRTVADCRLANSKQPAVFYHPVDSVEGVDRISAALDVNIHPWLNDFGCQQARGNLAACQAHAPSRGPFGACHNGDPLLARFCYALARAIRPNVVVETGVCYGVTSSFTLRALSLNGAGHLHSIDLPPLGRHGDRYVGSFIPADLRGRWTLHRGTTRRILGPLLRETGPIDMFVHDSLHSYRNMKMEFDLAWAVLRPGGVVLSDDIEGNPAFEELTQRPDAAVAIAMRSGEKNGFFGIAVKR